jgi:hypothetical protein
MRRQRNVVAVHTQACDHFQDTDGARKVHSPSLIVFTGVLTDIFPKIGRSDYRIDATEQADQNWGDDLETSYAPVKSGDSPLTAVVGCLNHCCALVRLQS